MAVNPSPFATNAHNVQVQSLDFTVPDAPTTKTYHGATIVVNGNIIGRVQSWQPTAYTREGVHIYELNRNTWGRPVDYVPGKQTGYTVVMARTEVWNQELEIALGFGAVFDDLADQTRPWTTQEYLFQGETLYRVWQYTGCWFQDRNEDAQTADGDGQFKVNATLAYVSRIRTR